MTRNFKIRDATVADIPIILQLIRDLATYERAPNDVVATEKGLHEVLFGAEPAAKVVIAFENAEPVGFAIYFFNFSTWLGRSYSHACEKLSRSELASEIRWIRNRFEEPGDTEVNFRALQKQLSVWKTIDALAVAS